MKSGDQGIDVGLGGVTGKGGPHSAGDTITLHDGLGAMVSGADGDAHLVEEGAYVVGTATAY